jgi:hypothetical protein
MARCHAKGEIYAKSTAMNVISSTTDTIELPRCFQFAGSNSLFNYLPADQAEVLDKQYIEYQKHFSRLVGSDESKVEKFAEVTRKSTIVQQISKDTPPASITSIIQDLIAESR